MAGKEKSDTTTGGTGNGWLPADQDVEFLGRYETRGARLGLDYLKPELLLSEQGVEYTIVVFGSTRIPEPVEAKRAVEDAREALRADPGTLELERSPASRRTYRRQEPLLRCRPGFRSPGGDVWFRAC